MKVILLKDVPGQVGCCIPLTHEEAFHLYTLLRKMLGNMEP